MPVRPSPRYCVYRIWYQKDTKDSTERFLIRQNKIKCKFSRESFFQSHKQLKKKKTYMLPVGFFQKDVCTFCELFFFLSLFFFFFFFQNAGSQLCSRIWSHLPVRTPSPELCWGKHTNQFIGADIDVNGETLCPRETKWFFSRYQFWQRLLTSI